MALGSLRALAWSAVSGVLGIEIILTRPTADDGPITTTGVWRTPLEDEQPYGSGLKRREPRQVMAIERSDTLDEVPRGTTILAADRYGSTARLWRVEGYTDRVEADRFLVILVPQTDIL